MKAPAPAKPKTFPAVATIYHSTDPDEGYVVVAAPDPQMLCRKLRKLGFANDEIDAGKFSWVNIVETINPALTLA